MRKLIIIAAVFLASCGQAKQETVLDIERTDLPCICTFGYVSDGYYRAFDDSCHHYKILQPLNP